MKGFSLIELILSIIIVGVISTVAFSKFINLDQDAQQTSVQSTAGSFKEAIKLARSVWVAKGASGPMDDVFVYNYNPDKSGTVDFNSNGWPAQHHTAAPEPSPALDFNIDCVTLWNIIFANDIPSISLSDNNTDYTVVYNSSTPGVCRYVYSKNSSYYFEYNSNTGAVETTI